MKKILKLPKFASEDEERDFWSKVDLSDYYDESDFKSVYFPDLKLTSQSISIRLPVYMLNRLKEKANSMNIPYQSYIKSVLGKQLGI